MTDLLAAAENVRRAALGLTDAPEPVKWFPDGERPRHSSIAFLAERSFRHRRAQYADYTWVGMSSDFLVEVAFGARAAGPEVDRGRYPYDYDDLDRCEQTFRLLPEKGRRHAAPLLEDFRVFVAERCGERTRPVRPLSATAAAAFDISP